MFSGIVEAVGNIASVSPAGKTATVRVDSSGLDLSDVAVGDSVAVNGICLTVTRLGTGLMEFDVSAETLEVTTGFQPGQRVNLETSLRLDARIGGPYQGRRSSGSWLANASIAPDRGTSASGE